MDETKPKTSKATWIIGGVFLLGVVVLFLRLTGVIGGQMVKGPDRPEVYNEYDGSVRQVKEWFRANLDDPKSLDVVEWGKVVDTPEGFIVRVKYRERNRLGGMALAQRLFVLDKGGKVLSHSDY
jgi:hypothetical protein